MKEEFWIFVQFEYLLNRSFYNFWISPTMAIWRWAISTIRSILKVIMMVLVVIVVLVVIMMAANIVVMMMVQIVFDGWRRCRPRQMIFYWIVIYRTITISISISILGIPFFGAKRKKKKNKKRIHQFSVVFFCRMDFLVCRRCIFGQMQKKNTYYFLIGSIHLDSMTNQHN